VSSFIRNRPSDLEGTKQLLFHLSFALAAAWCVKRSRDEGSMAGLIASELALGLVSSFYFTGFHEMCENHLRVQCGLYSVAWRGATDALAHAMLQDPQHGLRHPLA
jgi:hypothetical protein